MPKKMFRVVYAFNYITQVALSLLTPVALLMGIAWLLQTYCGAGKWVMVIAIVLGALSGLYSMVKFLVTMAHAIDPTTPDQKGASPDERKS